MTSLPTLREKLAAEGGNPTEYPFVVSCRYCQMTMWSTSDTARVDTMGNITCGCYEAKVDVEAYLDGLSWKRKEELHDRLSRRFQRLLQTGMNIGPEGLLDLMDRMSRVTYFQRRIY